MSHWNIALRSLARRPAFAATTVAVLAFGIGATSALYSIVDTVLLKPLPYPRPDRVVSVMGAHAARNERSSLISPAQLEDWNRLAGSFESISGSYAETVTDTSMGEPERLAGRRVGPGFFGVFGTAPLLGRAFAPEEERYGGPPAAVVSEGLWSRRYGRDPSAVGRRLVVGEAAYTIVGVMPNEFAAPSIEVWLPAQTSPWLVRIRDARFFTGIGRMKPGVTIAQATADLDAVCRRLGEQFPKTDAGRSALVADYKERIVGANSRTLWFLFGSTALLLLILCTNVAGLLLGQLQRRERELAIRASLGATRGQIAGVVLREVALLACAGGALGLVLGVAGSRALARVFDDLPRVHELRLDWRVALFTLSATALTALAFGMVPALRAMRRDVTAMIAAAGPAGARRRPQHVLVAAQFAMTLVLLAGAGLLLRTYHNLIRTETGFRPDNVLTFHLGAAWGEDRAKIALLQQALLEELERLPGVRAAGMANFLPASGATLREQASIEGLAELGDDGKLTVGTRMVTAGYLHALQVPILRGDGCPGEIRRVANAPAKVLVNRRFAEAAGGVDLVGRNVIWASAGSRRDEIAGVIGDVKEDALNAAPVPYVYVCLRAGAWPDPEYVVATTAEPRSVLPHIRQLVRRLAPDRAIFGVSTMREHLDRTLDRPRLSAGVLVLFAASALLAAALGLYGLMTLVVASRTREIGVRMALGATPRRIVGQIVREALRPLAAAVAIGAGAAVVVLRSFRAVLYEVPPADLATFSSACVLLVVVALATAIVPGWRAARIDPVRALRTE